MIVSKSRIVWALWIVAVICFAFATYIAPEKESFPTAPEFFFFALGMFHMVAGGTLLVHTFIEENDL